MDELPLVEQFRLYTCRASDEGVLTMGFHGSDAVWSTRLAGIKTAGRAYPVDAYLEWT